ncbi:MAG: sugar phosphate isomerase/epimerase family protein, partial [Bryobacteraceae bacterium]
MTRRTFLATVAATPAFAARIQGLKIGVTDWNLRQRGTPAAVELARRLGFDGVEVSLGRTPEGGKLPLDNSALQEQYLAEAKKHGIHLAGTCLDILHVNYLKNDRLGQKWIADGI